MQLRGQHGYAMVALLVGMSVAAILMTAAMPAWKQMARREKEEELVFRGQQYVRAISLFQRRSGPGVLPPNLDVLVNGRFLRKKYKDPITNDDFDLLSPVQQTQAGAAGTGSAGAGQQPATAAPQGRGTGTVIGAQPGALSGGSGAAGGIMGVASKSKEPSLRMYNGRTHYNEWQFVFVQQAQQAGAAAGGVGRGGQQNGRGQNGSPSQLGVGRGGPGREGQGRGPGGRGAGPGGRGIQPGSPFPNPQNPPFPPGRGR
jgi:type II secretory pathway pseudopilin PulG